jgi:hypothetical protein
LKHIPNGKDKGKNLAKKSWSNVNGGPETGVQSCQNPRGAVKVSIVLRNKPQKTLEIHILNKLQEHSRKTKETRDLPNIERAKSLKQSAKAETFLNRK